MLDAKPIGTEFHAGRYGHVPKPSLKFALPLDTPPMEAKLLAELPKEGRPWQYEPKWDGFRCLAFKRGDEVELRSKSGKPLGRYFPEIVAMLRGLKARQFVIDGELWTGPASAFLQNGFVEAHAFDPYPVLRRDL